MKKRILQVLVILVAISLSVPVLSAKPRLTDIDGHWGKEYIEYLVDKGAIEGYPDGTFRPDKTISNAEFITVVYKVLQEILETRPKYGILFSYGVNPDTLGDPNYKSKHWASEVHAFMYRNDLGGEDFSREELDKPVTRYTMAKVLMKMLNRIDEPFAEIGGIDSVMSDYKTVRSNEKYSLYVEQAFMKGIISGKNSEGLFDGKASGTRAQAVTMIVRAIDGSKRNEVVVSKKIPKTVTAIDENNNTLKEVLDLDWDKEGVIQIGDSKRQFGIQNGLLTVRGSTNIEFNYTRPVKIFTVEEWLSLPNFTYKGVEYETVKGGYFEEWLSRKTPLTIYLVDPYRPLIPIEGDTVIDILGNSTILKRHKETGVLSYGQNVNYYEGIKFPNGNLLKRGSLGTTSMGFTGQTYMVDERTGTGLFRDDWSEIAQYELSLALPTKNPKEGQIVGQWTQYIKGDWYWIGPINSGQHY